MKNLQSLKKFELSKEDTKKISGGDNGQGSVFQIQLCESAVNLAQTVIDNGFGRCPRGCWEQEIIWAANSCLGNSDKPWIGPF
ncbi:hypothetical protein [Tenacibaculum agarivorans]|uniref:hypothetical protein n=1 Tax=Tenacibaculum agarivorans TaxID=1908389 RepID=UPI00094B95D3|nr:hypothetical protein [Tenacibaculum agarivorans]